MAAETTEKKRRLSERIRDLDSQVAREKLENLSDAEIARTLTELGPATRSTSSRASRRNVEAASPPRRCRGKASNG
jgi:hypothetical protein